VDIQFPLLMIAVTSPIAEKLVTWLLCFGVVAALVALAIPESLVAWVFVIIVSVVLMIALEIPQDLTPWLLLAAIAVALASIIETRSKRRKGQGGTQVMY